MKLKTNGVVGHLRLVLYCPNDQWRQIDSYTLVVHEKTSASGRQTPNLHENKYAQLKWYKHIH